MQFEEALFSYLKSFQGLSSLVGERIYPLVIPQKASLPAVTYQRVSAVRQHALQMDTGYTTQMYQISCWSKSYAQSWHIASQLRLSLQNFSGVMGGAEGVHIDAVLLEGEMAGFEPDTNTYYYHMEFQFFYKE